MFKFCMWPPAKDESHTRAQPDLLCHVFILFPFLTQIIHRAKS